MKTLMNAPPTTIIATPMPLAPIRKVLSTVIVKTVLRAMASPVTRRPVHPTPLALPAAMATGLARATPGIPAAFPGTTVPIPGVVPALWRRAPLTARLRLLVLAAVVTTTMPAPLPGTAVRSLGAGPAQIPTSVTTKPPW